MHDLADILAHVAHANVVRGGGLLFSDGDLTPVLDVEAFVSGGRGGHPATAVRSARARRRGGFVRRTAGSSAEAVRALKSEMGVPHRPTALPVDEWSRAR